MKTKTEQHKPSDAANGGDARDCLPRLVLPAICWVHRPHALTGEIDEGEDLCPKCCEKRTAEYKARFPDHADEILTDGGFDPYRESEGLATCSECGCELSCYVLDTFDDVADWSEEDRCIDTSEDVRRAVARLDGQNSVIEENGGGAAAMMNDENS